MKGKYLDPYSGFEFDTDYIPREAARCLMYHKQHSLSEYDLNSIPAADVELVRHGWWIEQEDGSHFCSECACDARWKVDDISGAKVSFIEELSNYCPYCGAKMDEVTK